MEEEFLVKKRSKSSNHRYNSKKSIAITCSIAFFVLLCILIDLKSPFQTHELTVESSNYREDKYITINGKTTSLSGINVKQGDKLIVESTSIFNQVMYVQNLTKLKDEKERFYLNMYGSFCFIPIILLVAGIMHLIVDDETSRKRSFIGVMFFSILIFFLLLI